MKALTLSIKCGFRICVTHGGQVYTAWEGGTTGINEIRSKRVKCVGVEHTAEWEGGRGPLRVLLSSLQGLCSAELIGCEMFGGGLDPCLVCFGDWEKEADKSSDLWRETLS